MAEKGTNPDGNIQIIVDDRGIKEQPFIKNIVGLGVKGLVHDARKYGTRWQKGYDYIPQSNFIPLESPLTDFQDPQYGIRQMFPMAQGTRMYSWENPEPHVGKNKQESTGRGWGLLSDIEKAKAELYTGYNNGNYFTDGMSIRNTASPDHWRYKWFKQQEDDNYAWRESERDRIYDLWDRGEISDKERRKQRSDMLEKFRMNDRKWNHGMSEGGYKVPAHIRALYAVGLLKGY